VQLDSRRRRAEELTLGQKGIFGLRTIQNLAFLVLKLFVGEENVVSELIGRSVAKAVPCLGCVVHKSVAVDLEPASGVCVPDHQVQLLGHVLFALAVLGKVVELARR